MVVLESCQFGLTANIKEYGNFVPQVEGFEGVFFARAFREPDKTQGCGFLGQTEYHILNLKYRIRWFDRV